MGVQGKGKIQISLYAVLYMWNISSKILSIFSKTGQAKKQRSSPGRRQTTRFKGKGPDSRPSCSDLRDWGKSLDLSGPPFVCPFLCMGMGKDDKGWTGNCSHPFHLKFSKRWFPGRLFNCFLNSLDTAAWTVSFRNPNRSWASFHYKGTFKGSVGMVQIPRVRALGGGFPKYLWKVPFFVCR